MNLVTSNIEWNYSSGKWIGFIKAFYAYNSDGKQTSFSFSRWDNAKSDWFEDQKRNSAYFSNGTLANFEVLYYSTNTALWNGFKFERTVTNGKDTTSTEYSWNGTTNVWKNDRKYELSYNSAGKKTLETDYSWDTAQNSWLQDRKRETTYNGNTSTELTSGWDKTTSVWQNSTKLVSTISSDGKHKTNISYNWNWSYNIWEAYIKGEMTYGSQGKLLNSTSYKWNGTDWIADGYKEDYTYDGNKILSNAFWNNDAAYKNEYTYDGKGNNLTHSYYQWDTKSLSWYIYSKYEYTYDTNNNLTSILYSSAWNDKPFTQVSKSFYTYNSDNAKVYSVNYYWSSSNNTFVKSSSNTYFNSKNFVMKVRDINNMTAQMEKRINEAVTQGMSPQQAFQMHAR
jgi:hypothetical protein